MSLEEGVVPKIAKAYRIGSNQFPNLQGPREIIVIFMDYRTELKILEAARRKNHLQHQILVFSDLPHETLMKWKGKK